ncbi:hypothetical protein [Acinetobacter sp. H1(2024)]|uniref:hypothetical protein n=1 Tax=Acinetobacter sp. H1(2024) TaxID=3390190 RepID=UPI003979D69A
MKKLSTILTAGVLAMLSVSAFACPKGTQLQGGTGPHHKGGKCVAISGKTTAKKEAKKDMNEKKHAAMTSATNAKQEANQATHQMKQDAVKTANTAKKP